MKQQTREHITQAGGLILIGGAVFWGIAEVMALASGESSVESLVIASVAFLDLAIGIWSVRMLDKDPGIFTLAGIVALTIGFLLLGVIRITLAIENPGGTELMPADTSLFPIAAIISLLGALTFGVAIVRANLPLPRWTGAALILGMLTTLMVAAAEVPSAIPHIANLVMAVTFVAIGVMVVRGVGRE